MSPVRQFHYSGWPIDNGTAQRHIEFIPMAGAAPDRAAVEAHWRERLRDAKLRLDFARQYMKEVEQDRTEGAVPATDGEFAFQKALRAENHALAEYRRILRVFADLVVEGKMPDERQAAGG